MADYENIARDPDLFLRLNADRVVIDESQLLPAVFPALRVAIDSQREKPGRFVISGSSSPSCFRPFRKAWRDESPSSRWGRFPWPKPTNGHRHRSMD